jgi:hypothetical protein
VVDQEQKILSKFFTIKSESLTKFPLDDIDDVIHENTHTHTQKGMIWGLFTRTEAIG